MWFAALLAILSVVMFGSYWFIFGEESRQEQKEMQMNSLAQNMVVFHGAAANYTRTHQAEVLADVNTSVTQAVIGAAVPAIRDTNNKLATLLPEWFIPSGGWVVAWGRDPIQPSSTTVRLVATYLPENGMMNIRSVDIALALATVTGGNPAAGIVSNGQIVSPSLSGAANTVTMPVPVNDSGVPMINHGAAAIVTRVTF